jgi:WD40 repeat protein
LRRTHHLKYKGYLNYIQQKNVDTRLDSEPFSQDEDEEIASTQRDPNKNDWFENQNYKGISLNSKKNLKKEGTLETDLEAKKRALEPQVHPKERLQVRFLCLVFMNKDLLVTGGSNGFLYIFKKGVLIEEQIGHLKSPILCIDKSQFHENFFVTGGQDGSVNLWEIRNYQDSNVIEKLFEYNIYKNGKGLYDKTSLVNEEDPTSGKVLEDIGKER